MKSAPTRRLHMGCGEPLLGLLPSQPVVKKLPLLPAESLMKHGKENRFPQGKRK